MKLKRNLIVWLLIASVALVLTSKPSYSQVNMGYIIKHGTTFLLDSAAISRINRNYDSTQRCCIREQILASQIVVYRGIIDSLSVKVSSENTKKNGTSEQNLSLSNENKNLKAENKAIRSQIRRTTLFSRIKDGLIVLGIIIAVSL